MTKINAQPTIKTLRTKKLIGKRLKMSFSNNRTFELWRSFMPRRKEINLSSDLFSIEVYPPAFFVNIVPDREFDKWAAVEVTDFEIIPESMEPFILPEGLYAVFRYKGPASAGQEFYRYIFETWLPNSDFSVDNHPHFALMGEKYRYENPDSEEEIWIPIKQPVIVKQ